MDCFSCKGYIDELLISETFSVDIKTRKKMVEICEVVERDRNGIYGNFDKNELSHDFKGPLFGLDYVLS